MGSGSSGMGGSGGGGAGVGGLGGGGYRFEGGKFKGAAKPRDEVLEKVRKVLQRIDRSYLESHLTSPLLRSAYEQLFRLRIEIVQSRSWDGLANEVGSGPGCLAAWVEQLMDAAEEHDPQVRDLVRMCVEDFLITALGDDPMTYLQGDGRAIVQAADPNVFERTSNHFLGKLIWRLLERESQALTDEEIVGLRVVAQDLADRTIAAFERQVSRGGRDVVRRPHPGVPGESGLGHQGAATMNRLRKREVLCRVDGRQGRYGTQEIRLILGRHLTLRLQGELGMGGLPDRAADLLEFAALVYRLERLFRRQRTNPPRASGSPSRCDARRRGVRGL